MITGKDKERARKLEIQCELSKELIEDLKNDLELIGEYLRSIDELNTTGEPLWRLWNDIGRCKGRLNDFN